MKRRMMSIMLIMCMILTMMSATISAADHPVGTSLNPTIPNLLIQNVVTGETSRLLDDYQGKYRVILLGARDCGSLLSFTMRSIEELLRQYDRIGAPGRDKVSVVVLDISSYFTASDWADVTNEYPNVTISVDPDGK